MVYERLKSVCDIVLKDEPMKDHTYFKIGGKASYLVMPKSIDEIKEIIKIAKEERYPLFVIGNGSNLLVDDKGLFGIVIKIAKSFSDIRVDDNKIIASSGALLSKIASVACENNLSGFEFASGIPGTLGGAVKMNAGAYDGEIKDVVVRTTYLDKNGNVSIRQGKEHDFSYRHSIFGDEDIILESEIVLNYGDKNKIKEKMLDLNSRRKEKQPLEYPSAGSTFKRPEGYFAAKLIDDCNLRGKKCGGAMVSEKHCGFIINYDNASFNDVINLINEVKKVVYEKTNVVLCEEVKILKNN
ncbi:MAG: UDP-N-acetylmuramate dehydrogenase [Ruminococcaceae bacterium]|nr:UDP-N-acetylmuramate dehydrogenase [Oscillospiraceae bacterium]